MLAAKSWPFVQEMAKNFISRFDTPAAGGQNPMTAQCWHSLLARQQRATTLGSLGACACQQAGCAPF
tara:strand:- start:67 stop:267 length:201 start_codon:yes stop_codon:yes gene_type:complete